MSLATPTATLYYDGPQRTQPWWDGRLSAITATDVVKIVGLSPYGNALSVWAFKRGEIEEDEAGEAASWGLILERPIADEWARRRNTSVHPVGILAHVEDKWRRCSPDFWVRPCPDGDGPCLLQVKSLNAFAANEWRDDVPDKVLAQVQYELGVSGYAHEHVATLLGGQRLVEHRVERDEDLIAFLNAEARRVWDCVVSGEPPEVDYNALHRRVLDAMHPYREGMATAPRETVVTLLAHRADLSRELATLNAAIRETKTDVEKVDAHLVELMGGAEALAIEGQPDPVVLYREISRAGYTVGPKSYRQIKILENA